jgi:26S proteasome regulatory subunit (ATPase 3-interacting protein)
MKKPTDIEGRDVVLEYLTKQNRPYSAVDVFNNLNGQLGKTQVVKGLAALAQSGDIQEKEYGKQKVYSANQDEHTASAEETARLEEEERNKKDELEALTKECAALDSVQAQLAACHTTAQLKAEVARLQAEVDKKTALLECFQKGQANVSEADMKKSQELLAKNTRAWGARKRSCNDIINVIMENYPKKRQKLLEEVGIETDEDAGMNISDCHNLLA